MLIQITDPTLPIEPQQTDIAIGIDFGTTHCVVGFVENDHVQFIPLDGEGYLLPSVVAYDATSLKVGTAAFSDPYAIHSVKRAMGRGYHELEPVLLRQMLPAINQDGHVVLKTRQGNKSPIAVAADIFREIKSKTESDLGQTVTKAVVTVPAYFDEAARSSIKDAATIAGFDVLRLVAEPTAAALAYGLDDGKEGIYVVYDLGGGTFDVSVLRMTQGVFQVLATGGDPFLGGDDIDALIVDHFIGRTVLSLDQRRGALLNARHVKERLSSQIKATFDTPMGDRCVLKLEMFEELITPLINRTIDIMKDTLAAAEVQPAELHGVILVGGSTRIQKIHHVLAERFGVALYQSLNPDEVVAMGAARQASLLTRGGNSVLVDVTPLSLGVEMMGGIVDKIIPRNSPIPIRKAQNFTTFQDNQTGIVIHVVQGERELAQDCRSLGKFVLSGIPPMPAGMAKVKVTFALDADGLLTVSALEEQTGIAQTITVKPTYGLTEHAMKDMILESHKHAQHDMEERLLTQARIEATQLIQEVDKALATDQDLLSERELRLINDALESLRSALDQQDRAAILERSSHLNQLTEPFAQLRLKKYLG